MPADGRFGGHIVAGHVDGVGTVANVRRDDTAVWFTVRAAPDILRYIVEKGSVAIDGISLTVAAVTQTDFSISAIPHTVANTVLRERKRGCSPPWAGGRIPQSPKNFYLNTDFRRAGNDTVQHY